MWGALNIFGKKKQEVAETQSADDSVAVTSLSQTPDQAPEAAQPVYAPSPWDGDDMGMGGEIEAGLVARAGSALEPGSTVAERDAIAAALKTVYDP